MGVILWELLYEYKHTVYIVQKSLEVPRGINQSTCTIVLWARLLFSLHKDGSMTVHLTSALIPRQFQLKAKIENNMITGELTANRQSTVDGPQKGVCGQRRDASEMLGETIKSSIIK